MNQPTFHDKLRNVAKHLRRATEDALEGDNANALAHAVIASELLKTAIEEQKAVRS